MTQSRDPQDDGKAAGENAEHTPPASRIRRRTFLQQSAAIGVGALALGGRPSSADADPADSSNPASAKGGTAKSTVRRYKPLGKTGLEISDISFGTGALKHPRLLEIGLDRGINYFDTAESYPLGSFGAAEKAMGLALRSKRKDLVIASKAVVRPQDKRLQIMKKLNASLRRLQTDYIDVYFSHAVNDIARLENDEWFEFVEIAKKQGKIRFSGMSGHGGHLIACLDYAIDNDLVDVILAAHNFGQDPAFYARFLKSMDIVAIQVDLPRVFAKAHARRPFAGCSRAPTSTP
ncbi:MAG: aldo/keto reductase [Deltaproteobacteria bacterium]|nr:aldo/keto reductase [Deltaproteobacteria bacterium]